MEETSLEYRVFTLQAREDDSPYWFQIGRAFPHKDGSGGFTIRLNALPLSSKLVIRVFDPEAEENMPAAGAAEKKPAAKSQKPTAQAQTQQAKV